VKALGVFLIRVFTRSISIFLCSSCYSTIHIPNIDSNANFNCFACGKIKGNKMALATATVSPVSFIDNGAKVPTGNKVTVDLL